MVERSDAPAMPAHDPDAFWSLVQPHDRALRALAYRLVGDRELMDDVLQEAYLRAFRALPSLRGAEAVGSWLYRIVYNASMDQLRKRQRAPQVPLEDVPDRPDPAPDPGEVAAGRGDLAAALESLPPLMRAAVLLVDAEGLTYEEAGAIIGVPKGTVASRLSRAREVLRRALGTDTEGANER
ncbi:MAG TPA: sigma-70 family RNA polymerase sigma factor [Actinomycetota bacterium]|nr:sigma-70 family RNA polymerase sigma factor [Actinomycetota bacterium]